MFRVISYDIVIAVIFIQKILPVGIGVVVCQP